MKRYGYLPDATRPEPLRIPAMSGIEQPPTQDNRRAQSAQQRRRVSGQLTDVEEKFLVDFAERYISVHDEQATSVERVRLGRLGSGPTDWGITLRDSSGAVILTTSGLGLGVVDTDQLADGAVTVAKMDVAELSAITADLGTVTAGDLTLDALKIKPNQGLVLQTVDGGSPVAGATLELHAAGLTLDFEPILGAGAWLNIDGHVVADGFHLRDGSVPPRVLADGSPLDDLVLRAAQDIGTFATIGDVDIYGVTITAFGDLHVTGDLTVVGSIPSHTHPHTDLTYSSLTPGHILTATSPTTAAFQSPPGGTLPSEGDNGRFLQVIGGSWSNSAFNLPDGPGIEGQVFRADGDGHAAWALLGFSDIDGNLAAGQLPTGSPTWVATVTVEGQVTAWDDDGATFRTRANQTTNGGLLGQLAFYNAATPGIVASIQARRQSASFNAFLAFYTRSGSNELERARITATGVTIFGGTAAGNATPGGIRAVGHSHLASLELGTALDPTSGGIGLSTVPIRSLLFSAIEADAFSAVQAPASGRSYLRVTDGTPDFTTFGLFNGESTKWLARDEADTKDVVVSITANYGLITAVTVVDAPI